MVPVAHVGGLVEVHVEQSIRETWACMVFPRDHLGRRRQPWLRKPGHVLK